jgi:hypothetical protein
MSALGAHGASAMIVSIGFTPDQRALRGAGAQRGGESLQSGFGDAVPEPLRADVPFAAIARDRDHRRAMARAAHRRRVLVAALPRRRARHQPRGCDGDTSITTPYPSSATTPGSTSTRAPSRRSAAS